MKKFIIFSMMLTAVAFVGVSCSSDALDSESIITVNEVQKNQFDKWLNQNYVIPYNIAFKYRMEDIEADMNYTLVPAQYELSVAMAHMVKYLCLESYDEIAGINFTRKYFPKLIHLVGSPEYRNNGTVVLGTAEGGKKITLFNINNLGNIITSAASLNSQYFKTIHHEFTHILNQTKSYPTEFQEISGADYVSDSWSTAPYETEYAYRGFVSDYAQDSAGEDFAETLSIFVTHSAAQWANLLASAVEYTKDTDGKTVVSRDGRPNIIAKFEIVYNYMKDSFGIDLYKLRDAVQRRQADVVSGKLDLEDVSIDNAK